MRLGLTVLSAAMLLAAPGALKAQLVSETIEGTRRICTYSRPTPVLTSAEQTRQIIIPLGENCPAYYRGEAADRTPLPVTASLILEDEYEAHRRCQYGQAGLIWTRFLPIGFHCPLSAGMLPPDARDSPTATGAGDGDPEG